MKFRFGIRRLIAWGALVDGVLTICRYGRSSPSEDWIVDEPSQVKDFRRGCTQIHADAVGVDRLSGVIIGCAFRVMNGLRAGFSEKVYENSLAHELRKAGLAVL